MSAKSPRRSATRAQSRQANSPLIVLDGVSHVALRVRKLHRPSAWVGDRRAHPATIHLRLDLRTIASHLIVQAYSLCGCI